KYGPPPCGCRGANKTSSRPVPACMVVCAGSTAAPDVALTRQPSRLRSPMPMPFALTFRILPLAAVLALASLSPAAHAADMKIGYFDVRQVLAEVEEAKAVKDKLQKDIAAKQKQIDAKRDELEKLQREIEQKGPVLSQS